MLRRQLQNGLRLAFYLLLTLAPGLLWANPATIGEQTAAKLSLAAFFAAKPMAQGAVASLASQPKLPDVQAGEVRWSLPRLRFLSQRVSLIAEQGSGKSLRRWYVPVLLRWTKQVVTFKHDVSAQAMLDSRMLSIETKNIAGLRGQLWSRKADVLGMKTLRAHRRGDVVLSTKVVRPALIQRGDHVTILVAVAGLQVRAEGVALKSASRGQRLLVQNIRSRQILQSIVQDAHTVAVFLGGV